MKKGLLSLLAVALTIVSCQNYDDQFAELTGLVNTLSTEVAGLSQVKTDLGSVKATVDGLVTSISSIPTTDNSTALTDLLAKLVIAQADITEIEVILAGGVASADDLKDIDTLIDAVQASVNQLLTKNANITANIIINSTVTLAAAADYIELGLTSPAGYLVNGTLTVDHTALTAPQITEANILTKKIISVSGAVTVNGAVDLSGLSYVGGTYEIQGTTRPNDSTISSLGGDLKVAGKLQSITFPNIVSILGNVTVESTVLSVTSIDLSSVTTIDPSGTFQAGSSAAFNNLLSADFGKFPMTTINNAKLVTLNLGQTAVAGALSITAPKATAIDGSMTSAVSMINIASAASTSVIHFDSLETAAGGLTNTLAAARVSEFHLPKLTKVEGVNVVINAKTIDLSGLTKLVGNTLTINDVWYLSDMPLFVSSNANINFTGTNGPAHVNFPSLVLTGATITTVNSTTQVSVASTGDAGFASVLGNTAVVKLNLTAQAVAIAEGTGMNSLKTLNAVGKISAAAALNMSLTGIVGNTDALKEINASNFGVVTIGGADATTAVVTITTSGAIDDLEVAQNPVLASLVIGHGPHSYTGFPAQSVTVNDNDAALFKSVDLGSVTLLDTAVITGNAALKTITAPDAAVALLSNAVVSLTVTGNSLNATSTVAVFGTKLAEVIQPSLTTWKAYVAHVRASVTCTDAQFDAVGAPIDISFDYNWTGDGVTANNFANTTAGFIAGSGTINLVAELAHIDAN